MAELWEFASHKHNFFLWLATVEASGYPRDPPPIHLLFQCSRWLLKLFHIRSRFQVNTQAQIDNDRKQIPHRKFSSTKINFLTP